MSKQVYRVEVSEGGTIQWYDSETGKLHNESGPAIVYPNWSEEYYIHGERHNESGPAVVWPSGSKEYWIRGKLHNESGPAVVRSNGDKEYWIRGKLHNESGPAIVWSDGDKVYYLHGKKFTESEFLARNKTSCEEKTIVVDGQTYRLVKADQNSY